MASILSNLPAFSSIQNAINMINLFVAGSVAFNLQFNYNFIAGVLQLPPASILTYFHLKPDSLKQLNEQ